MKKILDKWLGRYFSNEEAVLLAVMLAFFMILTATVGEYLGPAFAALIIAFLLQGVVNAFVRVGASQRMSVVVAFLLFLIGLVTILVGLVPIVGRQMTLLLREAPDILERLQVFLASLPER